MVEVISDEAKAASDYANQMLAKQKEQQAKIVLERDAKLKKAGLDKDEGFLAEKLAEVREIATETERIVKKKADASESEIPKPTSEAADNTATLSQVSPVSHTFCTTSSISPEDTSLLDHLDIHYRGELPQFSFNSNS
jgi:hypothetical protein